MKDIDKYIATYCKISTSCSSLINKGQRNRSPDIIQLISENYAIDSGTNHIDDISKNQRLIFLQQHYPPHVVRISYCGV